MTKDLMKITVGELKDLLADIDDATEIDVWDSLGLVTKLELEVCDWGDAVGKEISINIDGVYPY